MMRSKWTGVVPPGIYDHGNEWLKSANGMKMGCLDLSLAPESAYTYAYVALRQQVVIGDVETMEDAVSMLYQLMTSYWLGSINTYSAH